MNPKIMLKNYWRTGLISLALLISWLLFGCNSLFKPEARPFGYHALKINGRFVGPEVFQKEQRSFFMRWKRNGAMRRRTDEERMDLELDEIIDETVLEDFLRRKAGVTVSPQEADDYINRYIKTKYASAQDFSSFLQNADYQSEADLKKGIEIYLLKLRYFPRLAKEMGMTVPQAELDSLYKKHTDEDRGHCHPKGEFADMTLLERFGESEQLKKWLAGIKAGATVEILDPAMNAYRLYRDGRYDQAGGLYEKVFRKQRQEFHLQRAIESYQMAKNWKKVIQTGRVGMQRYPEKISYQLNTAEAIYRNGQTDEAMKLLKNAETRSQGNLFFTESVIQTYTNLGLTNEAERMKNGSSK